MKNHARKKGLQVLERRLKLIKEGNTEEREAMLRDYMPFIVKSVSKCIDRYLDSLDSDEFSVGLEAFDEAISRYDFEKGNFIAYAGLVISSRIKDYLKKENRCNAVPLSFFGDDSGGVLDKLLSEGDFTYGLDIKGQMDEFKVRLELYGITLEQLVDESPKHRDTRMRALAVARHVSRHEKMRMEFQRKRKLPYGMIRDELDISQKALRKSSNFIAAAVIILMNDWPELRNQLPDFGEEGGGMD